MGAWIILARIHLPPLHEFRSTASGAALSGNMAFHSTTLLSLATHGTYPLLNPPRCRERRCSRTSRSRTHGGPTQLRSDIPLDRLPHGNTHPNPKSLGSRRGTLRLARRRQPWTNRPRHQQHSQHLICPNSNPSCPCSSQGQLLVHKHRPPQAPFPEKQTIVPVMTSSRKRAAVTSLSPTIRPLAT